MANVIIGTAGHIDHGKTTLIKALTGIETDRLKEEKRRGITIELGFAYFDLPSNRRAGIIDVPGHEKFIKNMLAGATGIDLVLFVVAADEGVMPQTIEHLDILNILGVEKGIIVITKKDLVEEDILEMVKEEIRETVKETFLENSDIVAVSSTTGENLDILKQKIDEYTKKVKEHNIEASFRLNIDRVFTLKGHGTVVTGTLLEGEILKNENIVVYPSGKEVKVRSIQVHGQSVEKALAGQRTAINLVGIKKEELNRGDVLAKANSLKETKIVDIKLKLLKRSKRELKNFSRVRFYHGTKEIMARLILLNSNLVKPGEEVYAQLRLEESTALKYGDKFVIRFYSPMETIGGGIVLEPAANKHKRFNDEIIEQMMDKEKGSLDKLIETFVYTSEKLLLEKNEVMSKMNKNPIEIEEKLNLLIEEGILIKLGKDLLSHFERLRKIEEKVLIYVDDFHKKNQLKEGINKEEIKSKFFKDIKGNLFDLILDYYTSQNTIKMNNGLISLKNFKVELSDKQQDRKQDILNMFESGEFKPPTIKSLENVFSEEDFKLMNLLLQEGKLIRINSEIIYEINSYLKMKKEIIKYIEENGKISAGDLKELIDTSRKYSIPFLEHLDENKITKRIENYRILF